MKKLIFILGLVAALVLPAAAQFKGTNGTAFGYASSLGPGDVFIIGRPGSTNYNLASSNLLSFLGTVTSGAISLPVSLAADSFAAASSVGTVGTMFGPYWTSIGSKMTLNPQGGSTTNLELILDNSGGGKAHLRSGTYYGDGAGVSNAVTIIAGTNVNVLTNGDGRTFTVSGSAGLTNSTSTSLGAGKISGAGIGTNIAWSAVTGVPALFNAFSLLSDPNADRLVFWDDSAGAYAFLSLGTGLMISGTTISASGSSGSQTPWLTDIEANNFGIVHSSGIGGRDDANGAALVLFSEDTDASVTLYNYSTGFGIRYASSYGHQFTGPVVYTDGVTFNGGITNALPWSIASATVTSATITNLTVYSSAFASATNTLALGNKPVTLIVGTDCAVTNLSGVSAGQENWASLQVSNSAASAISAYMTVGATVRAQGAATTNRLVIGAGKVGYLTVQALGGSTNYWTTAQQ